MPMVTANGITIHYIDEGGGPPFVWLPRPDEHAAMAMQAHRRLLDRYRIVAIDPRGQGGTTAFAVAASYAPSLTVADLRELLDALGLDRPMIGGHSRGARAALEFARVHPERVRALVAVAPPVEGTDAPARASFVRAAARLRREGLEPFLAGLPGASPHAMRRAQWEGYLRGAGVEAVASQYEELARLGPLTEDTDALTMPVLIVCGEHDRTLTGARALAAAIPSSQLAVVPGAGHTPVAEAPTPYFAALDAFLGEVSGGGAG